MYQVIIQNHMSQQGLQKLYIEVVRWALVPKKVLAYWHKCPKTTTLFMIFSVIYYLDLPFIGSECKNTIIGLPQVCLSFISLGSLAVEWIENWQSNEIENLSPIVNSLTLSNLVYLLCTFKVEHPVWLPNEQSRKGKKEKRKENWSVGFLTMYTCL